MMTGASYFLLAVRLGVDSLVEVYDTAVFVSFLMWTAILECPKIFSLSILFWIYPFPSSAKFWYIFWFKMEFCMTSLFWDSSLIYSNNLLNCSCVCSNCKLNFETSLKTYLLSKIFVWIYLFVDFYFRPFIFKELLLLNCIVGWRINCCSPKSYNEDWFIVPLFRFLATKL